MHFSRIRIIRKTTKAAGGFGGNAPTGNIMSDGKANGNATNGQARLEFELRASELSYRRLFESAQDSILILDVESGRITDANPFLVKLLGYGHEEMVEPELLVN